MNSEDLVICDHLTWFFLLCKGKLVSYLESSQVTHLTRLTVFSRQYCEQALPCEECDISGIFVRHENAAARVRRRIKAWVDTEGHGSRKLLADAVKGLYGKGHSSSWVTDIIDGPDKKGQDLRLRDLDAVAEKMGVPPGDLVRRDDNMYAEVTPTEQRILRFYRALPDVARHHLVAYFDYLYTIQQKMLETQAEERDARTAETKRMRAMEQRIKKRPTA